MAQDSENKGLPELHFIKKPEYYPSVMVGDGADSYAGAYNHPNSRYYVINDYYNMQSDETLHILSHFETYQQTREYSCGAACALMVLNRFGKTKFHESALAQIIDSSEKKGSTVENMADFFDLMGWNVEYHASTEPRFSSEEEFEAFVIEQIDKGIPVMVDWVDWMGHWQVIIGIDTCGTDNPVDDVLIFADPYDVTDHFQDGYYIFPLARFFQMWREGPCAQKREPYVHTYVMAWPQDSEG